MKGPVFATPGAAPPLFALQHWLFQVLFPKRLHRPAYFFRAASLSVVASMLYANNSTLDPRYFWLSLFLLVLYDLSFVVLPRIRDAGMSPWWLATLFIPVADSVLGTLLLFRAPALLRKPPTPGVMADNEASRQASPSSPDSETSAA